ncbi:MAG: molybdopterin-dependent oxidoreductase [Anaerolineae bacterium]|nr:molybdopterin-dependent oxidoreductase [Anaerolineae bacterium]
MTVIKSVCGMCGGSNCGIDVTVEDGRVVDVTGTREYPVNRGRLCVQARAALEMTNDPQRLSVPLRRDGHGWREISWDEALDTIAAKLTTLKADHGAQALAVYQGRALLQFIKDGWVRRFMNLYGTPNFVRNEHMCAVPIAIAERLTYGTPAVYYGIDGARTNCFLLWGSNPVTSHLPTIWPGMLEARRRGAKLIVVDPRRTRPAEMADIHLAPRPGTDAALALGFIHTIIFEELVDADFVAEWTSGFDALARRAEPYAPESVAATTGVPAADIRAAARLYATSGPAFLDVGNALEHHSNGSDAIRAVLMLRALTGNLDVPGGHLLSASPKLADMMLKSALPAGLKPLGTDRHPLMVDMADFVPGDALVSAILEHEPYPVRAMIAGGGNMMLTWPNTAAMRDALEALDFFVVLDLYMTETARLADLVLPMADPFEQTQLVIRSGFFGPDRPTGYAMLSKRVKDPGQRRSDWWFWRTLAHRMGYGDYFPWETVEQSIDAQLEPLGLTARDLEDNPAGVYVGEPVRYHTYRERGFRTPTGKVELYSHVLAAHGYDPLPRYCAPCESPQGAPELARDYPLILNAGHKVAAYTHSRHRNLPSLRRREPEPVVELNPATARGVGVADGDRVRVESPRGDVTLKAWVTDTICPDVAGLVHGWSEANVNLLTDHEHADPVLGCPPLRSALCRVERLPNED